jgi:hypothetical protein
MKRALITDERVKIIGLMKLNKIKRAFKSQRGWHFRNKGTYLLQFSIPETLKH